MPVATPTHHRPSPCPQPRTARPCLVVQTGSNSALSNRRKAPRLGPHAPQPGRLRRPQLPRSVPPLLRSQCLAGSPPRLHSATHVAPFRRVEIGACQTPEAQSPLWSGNQRNIIKRTPAVRVPHLMLWISGTCAIVRSWRSSRSRILAQCGEHHSTGEMIPLSLNFATALMNRLVSKEASSLNQT